MAQASIPVNSSGVTAEWLGEALRAADAIDNATITAVAVEDIGAGVGMMGEVVRVTLTYASADPALPQSMVGKFPASDPGNREVAQSLYFYPREIGFYTQLAQFAPLRTPALYYADIDMADHSFVLLLEDLAGAEPGDQVAGTTSAQTRRAISEIAKLHGAFWNKVDNDEMAALFDFADPTYCAAVETGYQAFLGPAFDKFGDRFTAYARRVAEDLGPRAAATIADMSTRRRSFCHGDFRADNMLFGSTLGETEFALLDWQISGRGNPLYDIAYLVCNSVPVEQRAAAEESLLREYHGILQAMGVEDYSFDDCVHDYRQAVLCGLFVAIYACGGLDLANERGLAAGTAILDRVVAAVDAVQAGDTLPA